ncbi:MAG TPA: MotA/TolQ/ExbB proton channel family protein [Methanobacteriaceae archaeon]|jgi:biopolymer transport protein ExbB/TolQ|nr:MotA/TolQ/ExbB proton channel family protein [Methanobacteriaceae archaeon]
MAANSIYNVLSNSFHNVSQILLVPVIIILLIFVLYAVASLGGLIYEYNSRRKTRTDFVQIENIILSISSGNSDELIREIDTSKMPSRHKEILLKLVKTSNLSPDARELMARKMIENEEVMVAKRLEKTDIIAKIGPAVGLMGTLIPLGPGLAALGAGNIQELASHLILAFDAAILGMASAALGFTISKIRRRWYEEELSNLEGMAESVLEVLKS